MLRHGISKPFGSATGRRTQASSPLLTRCRLFCASSYGMNNVRWLTDALSDLDAIGTYIAEDDEQAAARIVQRIFEAVALLSWHPKLGRLLADGDTRRLTVTGTPYIAFYRLRDQIESLAVLHGARRFPTPFQD